MRIFHIFQLYVFISSVYCQRSTTRSVSSFLFTIQGNPQTESRTRVVEESTSSSARRSTQRIATTVDDEEVVEENTSATINEASSTFEATLDSITTDSMSSQQARTSLIRPSSASTWERPADPKKPIQPGLIAVSSFAGIGLLVVMLVLIRHWFRVRRNAKHRARSLIFLLNQGKRSEALISANIESENSKESASGRGTMFEVEAGIVRNVAGVGAAVHNTRMANGIVSVAPIAAQARPFSIKGFKYGRFPTGLKTPSPSGQIPPVPSLLSSIGPK